MRRDWVYEEEPWSTPSPSPRKSWGSDLLGPDKQNEVTPGQGQGVVQAFRTGLPQTLLQMVGQSYTNKALTEMLPRK